MINNQTIEPAYDNGIPIIFSTDNNFIPYLGVAIKSLISKTSVNNNYDITILYSDIDDFNLKRLKSLGQSNVSIRFYDMTYLMEANKDDWYVHWDWSNSVYFRFFIPKIFNSYKKVIFLDADIIVNCDIKELYDQELNNKLIGAVADIPRQLKGDGHYDFITNKLGLVPEKYFNAGVFVLNLERINYETFSEKCINVLKNLDKPPFQDQDVFNFVFKNNVKYLSNKYNLSWNCIHFWNKIIHTLPEDTYSEYLKALEAPKIIHYAGKYKPWKQPWLYFAEYFWMYARQTIFYEEILYKNTKTIPLEREAIKNAIYRHKIYFKYLRCKLLKFICFGTKRKHYIEKTKYLKNKVNDYRKTLE